MAEKAKSRRVEGNGGGGSSGGGEVLSEAGDVFRREFEDMLGELRSQKQSEL